MAVAEALSTGIAAATLPDMEPLAADEPDPIVLPIEDSLDLHAFAPRDIPSVVDEYLRAAADRGFSEVRLIHGRGKGVQRAVVQEQLRNHPLVERFTDAPADRGGWGATIAMLKLSSC